MKYTKPKMKNVDKEISYGSLWLPYGPTNPIL